MFSTLSFAAISAITYVLEGISYLRKGQRACNGVWTCLINDSISTQLTISANCAGKEEPELAGTSG